MDLIEKAGLWIFLYLTLVGMVTALLLVESRLSWRWTLLLYGGLTVVDLIAIVVLYRRLGSDAFARIYTLLVHVPSFFLFCFIGRRRGWQMVFQMLSTILFCFLIQQTAALVYVFAGERLWVLVPAYAVVTPAVLLFVLRVMRPLSRRVFDQVHRGWWLMCLLLAAHYGITIYLIPGFAGVGRLATVLKPALSLLMAGVYAVFLYLLATLQREMEMQHDAELSALRLSALQKRLDDVQAAEEAIRVERHDLRHRLQTVAGLVEQGRGQEALNFIGAAQRRLDEVQPVQWCRPPVLDAVFSSYFDQARRKGIRVEADIQLSGPLPVEEGELAIVLANALENAINACAQAPRGERVLSCRVICHPRLMFQIRNSCVGTVRFDERGQPLSDRAGHGFGTRSIAAFCRKYGAVCQYEQREGHFSLQVVL